jgi:hypothetical protein
MKLKCRSCGGFFASLPEFTSHRGDVCAAVDYDLFTEDGDNIPKVEPTPRLADECKKLLDNGWRISLFLNQLGSYTARGRRVIGADPYSGKLKYKTVVTDDFEPSAALYRLTEQVFGNIV